MPSPPSIDTFRVKKLVQIVIVNSGSLGAAQIEVFDLFSSWVVPNGLSKFVVTISSTQLDQLAAVGTKSDPRAGQGRPGPSEGLFWAKTGPFRCPRSAFEVC